jgi:hypothetical protein
MNGKHKHSHAQQQHGWHAPQNVAGCRLHQHSPSLASTAGQQQALLYAVVARSL